MTELRGSSGSHSKIQFDWILERAEDGEARESPPYRWAAADSGPSRRLEMDWRPRLRSAVTRSDSIPGTLLVFTLAYSFASQFLPIEPYLVPYLTTVKGFTNDQVTVDIFPVSVCSQLMFTVLVTPACYYLSHKFVITLGTFGLLVTYLSIWAGRSLLAMQLSQVTYGFGVATRTAFSSYLFLAVTEENYQAMISFTTTSSLFSFMFASELGLYTTRIASCWPLKKYLMEYFFLISLSMLSMCCALAFLLPKDHSSASTSHLLEYSEHIKEWTAILKETWNGQTLRILSIWWAFAFAGISLVQNYGTNLFDAIDSQSKLNGHIMAASLAVASVGSYCGIYIERIANRTLIYMYVLGSTTMGLICIGMGASAEIWAAYIYYVTISGIYQLFACLVSVQCGKLLSNGQYILLISINNVFGLLVETLLQAAVEAAGFSIFFQFISFSGLIFLATVVISWLLFSGNEQKAHSSCLISESEHEYLVLNSD